MLKIYFTNGKTIPNHDKIHNQIDPHGIYKYHNTGHQEHAWYIRTNPKVIEIFQNIWKTDDLVVSFDGSCYISKIVKNKIIFGHILTKHQIAMAYNVTKDL